MLWDRREEPKPLYLPHGKIAPHELVIDLPLGEFLAAYLDQAQKFRVRWGGERVSLRDFERKLADYRGLTSVNVERTERRGLFGRKPRLLVTLVSTLNPLPGLAERPRLIRSGKRGKEVDPRARRNTIDYVYRDEVSPGIMKTTIATHYKARVEEEETARIISEIEAEEKAHAERGEQAHFVPAVDQEDPGRNTIEEVLSIRITIPDHLPAGAKRDYFRREFARVEQAYGLTDEQINRAKEINCRQRTKEGQEALLVAFFRLTCPTLPQYEYPFALEAKEKRTVPQVSTDDIPLDELLDS